QAEDGIRDFHVTGVQTCALPICCFWRSKRLLDHLDERAQELLAAVGLAADRNTMAASLPYGRKRALEIAMTLALEPDVMLLDEQIGRASCRESAENSVD